MSRHHMGDFRKISIQLSLFFASRSQVSSFKPQFYSPLHAGLLAELTSHGSSMVITALISHVDALPQRVARHCSRKSSDFGETNRSTHNVRREICLRPRGCPISACQHHGDIPRPIILLIRSSRGT
ncbi:hypothetical protein BDN71DRAFT_1157804 [Pleurotus eryngii]|uniref:Uncharacterized protein n=1 Tax=Pleurotus eryngii TaxID=5323 RepID=A0A9P5ZUR9_PLEER|nr:hypothetical protein BDN71DRAFT_1157804 [Pleurotus eryngii]